MKSILIFGTVPPPYGGVTRSVENLIDSLKAIEIKYTLFSKKILTMFQKYDIAHIHYTKKWKIITAAILGKIFAHKSILTYHGSDFYPDTLWIDNFIFNIFDGIIVLNQLVENRCNKLNPQKTILFTPIFQEGIIKERLDKKALFKKRSDEKYILLYASGKAFFENKEVYGCNFIFSILKQFPKNYRLVFADPLKGYVEDVKKLDSNIIYFDENIDFLELLSNVDVYIRPTNFDGNSVSILEALSCNTPVLASDVVDRGVGVDIYKNNDEKDFLEKLKNIINKKQKSNKRFLTSINDFKNFCNKILGKNKCVE